MVIADFSGSYLNNDTAKENDVCTIIGEGAYREHNYEGKITKSLDIPVRNGIKELIYTPKMDAGKKLVKAFGSDTLKWVNKQFKVHIVRTKSFGAVKVPPCPTSLKSYVVANLST